MPLINQISRETVAEENRRLWGDARETWGNVGYGGPMPDDERGRMQAILHGLEVLAVWDEKGSALQHLRSYGVPTFACEYLISSYCVQETLEAPIVAPRTSSRAGKYEEFEQWAGAHAGEQFSTEQLMEVSGFSRPTILKYLKESLYFVNVKKGLWEARELPDRQ